MKHCYWIWYPGDFELYYAMKQNFSRIERGYGWPAFWKSEGFRNRVVFRKTYLLREETAFRVTSKAAGYCLVQTGSSEKKYPFGSLISCGPGEVSISIHAGCVETFPSVFIEGDMIFSNGDWMAEDYASAPVPAGYCKYFVHASQNPSNWEYSEKVYEPVSAVNMENGVLYEFETELTAVLKVTFVHGKNRPLTVYCGESKEEALDMEQCYYSWQTDAQTGRTPCSAFRFVFIAGCTSSELHLRAIHQYVDIPVRAKFRCDDELLNRIWEVAEHTFRLCSGIFFIDGVKRDKWIWSGDAYQSFFVNQYLMADIDINRRTLLALRGNDPMTTHINTIVDYSLFWILGVKAHYDAYADRTFVRQVYPKMCSLMEFCEKQTDENGFLIGRKGDWIFIDWAQFDKDGPLCAEQMLYAACWKAMAQAAQILGEHSECFQKRYEQLARGIQQFYWDETQGAFVDSFTSGKRHVTRHANIFAVLFDLADENQKKIIAEHVLFHSGIPAITTPYFKFYELDALGKMGYYEEILHQIKSYWGGMLKEGAVTFWEEYDPKAPQEEKYDMYGDKFGKSLCHAWAASPIYLLAKYFAGLKIIDPVNGKYNVTMYRDAFSYLDSTLPVGNKNVRLQWDGKECIITESLGNTQPA